MVNYIRLARERQGMSEKKKMGRPIIGKPKTIDVKFRLDEQTHEKLIEYSKKTNISKSEAIRKAVCMLLDS